MLLAVWDQIQSFLGAGRKAADLNTAEVAIRTVIVYLVSLALVRVASRRFLSQATAFDVIVGIMLGSIMSRAINGSALFFPTLVAGLVLVGLHWLFAFIAFRTSLFGPIVKGEPVLLIKDGEVQQEAMRSANLTSRDLHEFLRLASGRADPKKIRRAYMERNGNISVVPYEDETRILDVRVEDGVQSIRIKLE
ncbi:MAG: DUF421 domain-containing protein [Hyphomicrobiaceae bacterium]|nr:DUF421 domain-containing protein [Hyphomicrobiaceae bacterium]